MRTPCMSLVSNKAACEHLHGCCLRKHNAPNEAEAGKHVRESS